jgi:hypothetical protein
VNKVRVQVTRDVELDVEAVVQLTAELLENLDAVDALADGRVPPQLRRVDGEDSPHWSWNDVVRNWLEQRET